MVKALAHIICSTLVLACSLYTLWQVLIANRTVVHLLFLLVSVVHGVMYYFVVACISKKFFDYGYGLEKFHEILNSQRGKEYKVKTLFLTT